MGDSTRAANEGTVDVQNPTVNPFAIRQDAHINFSLEDFEIASDDTPAFGQKCSFTIPKRTTNYLLTNLKLQFSLPAITTSEAGVSGATWINWVNSIGHALIKSVVIKSGNNTLDTHTGAFMEMWNELSVDSNNPYNNFIGKYKHGPPRNTTSISAKTFTIQLQFWFCRGATGRDNIDATSLALPIGWLQQNMQLELDIENAYNLLYTNGTITNGSVNTALTSCKLITEYAVLDLNAIDDSNELTEVSQRFYEDYQQQMTFVQRTSFSGTATASGTKNVDWKNFESSITELLWYIQKEKTDGASRQDRFKFSYYGGNILSNCSVEINNDSISVNLPAEDFCRVIPLTAGHKVPRKKVHVYPFSILPSKFSNPSGFYNVTDATQTKLVLTFSSFTGAYEGELYALGRKIIFISGGNFITQDIT